MKRSPCRARFSVRNLGHAGRTLEQSITERLHPMERTHARAVLEELQPMERTHSGEVCEGLYAMGGTPRLNGDTS